MYAKLHFSFLHDRSQVQVGPEAHSPTRIQKRNPFSSFRGSLSFSEPHRENRGESRKTPFLTPHLVFTF